MFKGSQLTASDALKELKTQLLAEMQEEQNEKNKIVEKERIVLEIAAEAKLAPKPVNAKIAAGEKICPL